MLTGLCFETRPNVKPENVIAQFFKTMRGLLLILLLTISFTVFGQKDSLDIWISKINNRSIAGQCNYVWVLRPTTKEVDKIIGTGQKAEKKLLKLLTTEDKGIVAHYILSNIYKQTSYQILHMDTLKFETNFIYNGLEFTETETGMITSQTRLDKCKEEWIRKLRELKTRYNTSYKSWWRVGWQNEDYPVALINEEMLKQKIDYIHNNPVRAGLVNESFEYLYSSAHPLSPLKVMKV
jgi:hypothetical protein